jgi:hypothetical protein
VIKAVRRARDCTVLAWVILEVSNLGLVSIQYSYVSTIEFGCYTQSIVA